MLFAVVLIVATGAGGCWWPINAKAVLIDISFWYLSNNPPSYASVSDSIPFLNLLHSTCTVTFSGVIYCIDLMDFGPRGEIIQLCLMLMVMICRIYPSKCGKLFRFFCVLLKCLDMFCCNLEI